MSDYDSTYYQENAQAGDRPALNYYYRFFKQQMGKPKGRPVVLECGCGVGHLTKRLCNDYETYALDISDYALKQVNKNAPKAITVKNVEPKTIKNIPKLKDGSLDGIIGLHIMEHLERPEEAFAEFYEKLKPGGLLIYVVPNPDGFGHKIKKDKWFGFSDKTHVSLLGEKQWVKLTKQAGFDVKSVKGDGMWDVPYFPAMPTVLQKLFFFPPAALQVVTGKAFLPTILGECLIVVARKPI